MISAVYVLYIPESESTYHHYQLLLNRRYHENIPSDTSILTNFNKLYHNNTNCPPVLYYHGISYGFIRCDHNIILLGVTPKNINIMSLMIFLGKFYEILVEYLLHDQIKLDRDLIMDNLTLIFELLDECLDFGIVQSTDYKLLHEFIKVDINLPSESTSKSKSKSTHNQADTTDVSDTTDLINSSILRTYSSNINWRPKGIFYGKNEIYIDLIEDLQFEYDLTKGIIKRNEILGTCMVKCYLSGMPVCRIGFNEKYMTSMNGKVKQEEVPKNQLEVDSEEVDAEEMLGDTTEENVATLDASSDITDPTTDPTTTDASSNEEAEAKYKRKIPLGNIQFHQCIELSKLYHENLITFIPPDDQFILMKYSIDLQKQPTKLPLIMITPTFKLINTKLQLMCIVKTNFNRRRHCKNLIIKIPIIKNLFRINNQQLKYKAEIGEVSFKVDSHEIIWKIDTIDGKQTVRMMAEISLQEQITTEQIAHSLQTINRNIPEEQPDNARQELDEFYGVHHNNHNTIEKIQTTSTTNDISITFQIPMLTYSSLKLTYLSVEESQLNYSCFPWVRYITQSQSQQQQQFLQQQQSKQSKHQPQYTTKQCYYRFKLGIKNYVVE
ncbi:AP-1 complex subunit mu-1-I [Spathaspora sp. JA1]|nr:AP-1 complex subunit mu-1-I [Spathaspora sp. JA1]